MYIQLNHIVAHLKLIQHHKSSMLPKKKKRNPLGTPASGLKVWLKASFLGPGDRMLCQGSYWRGTETSIETGPVLGDRWGTGR